MEHDSHKTPWYMVVVYAILVVAVVTAFVISTTNSYKWGDWRNESKYTSSILVEDQDSLFCTDEDLSNYSDLAKITLSQAEEYALAEVPGKAVEAKLENNYGNLVYSIEIINTDVRTEVIVDAGNGNILAKNTCRDFRMKDFDDWR